MWEIEEIATKLRRPEASHENQREVCITLPGRYRQTRCSLEMALHGSGRDARSQKDDIFTNELYHDIIADEQHFMVNVDLTSAKNCYKKMMERIVRRP